jgi:hypothetical protein
MKTSRKIELTKWDWLAHREGLAFDRAKRGTAPKPRRGLAENQLSLDDLPVNQAALKRK